MRSERAGAEGSTPCWHSWANARRAWPSTSPAGRTTTPWQRGRIGLPLRSGAFDLATMILGLEFQEEPARALREAHRVLRPGGRLVAAILDRSGLWTLWRRLERRFVRSIWREARFPNADELDDLLRARSFAAERWQRAVHFLPLLARERVGWLERWETIGARWMPGWAAFVAVAARRA